MKNDSKNKIKKKKSSFTFHISISDFSLMGFIAPWSRIDRSSRIKLPGETNFPFYESNSVFEANRIDFSIEVIWPFHPDLSPPRHEIELFRGFTGQLKWRSRIYPPFSFFLRILLRFIQSSSTRKLGQIDLNAATWKIPSENFHRPSIIILFAYITSYLFENIQQLFY